MIADMNIDIIYNKLNYLIIKNNYIMSILYIECLLKCGMNTFNSDA